MDELRDLIHVHENVLNQDVCNFLVNFFEENTNLHERYDENGSPTFTQINFTQNRNISDEVNSVHTHIIRTILEYRDNYYEFIDKRVFPEDHAFEQFRIKKYNPGGEDRFDTHVDVTNHDTSRRFLSFMWYLNDIESGGLTVFKDLTIQPKQGTLVIFPPLWMYPHRGEPPISGSKYIMSTYLHYK
jgi:hypothetical protein